MTTALYVPGTSEQDMSKVIMSAQLVAGQTAANTDAITTNTANIATNTTNITTLQALVPAPRASNVLSGDVAMGSIGNVADGPSMAQGTSGTWFVSGSVTVLDTVGVSEIDCKLWDGATVIASGSVMVSNQAASQPQTCHLSGFITSPAGNIKISCKNISRATGVIKFNLTGNSKDSSIWGIRIA